MKIALKNGWGEKIIKQISRSQKKSLFVCLPLFSGADAEQWTHMSSDLWVSNSTRDSDELPPSSALDDKARLNKNQREPPSPMV